ncbi:DNA/RNA polymerases superfamily protein [Tanacetum coccineum]
MRNVLQERGSGSLPSSTETNPRDHVKSISTYEETETPSIRCIGSHQYGVSSQQKDDNMPLMELNRATIPFHGRLREYGYDKEEIKTIMNSRSSIILDDDMPRKEKDPGSFTLPCYINNMSFNTAVADLGASVSVIPYSTFTNLGLGELAPKLIIELADRNVKRPKGIAENVLVGIDKFVFPVDFIVLDMPEDIKVPLILRRPFLSTAHAKIDVYVLGQRERMKLDLEARLMGEALILKRSQDPKFGDFLELNDLNEPLELSRNQEVDDLGPTIKEGEIIDKPMVDIVKTRHDDENIEGINEYLSFCNYDR